MKLYDIYKDHQKGKINDAQAAALLNMTERDWKFRMTRHGGRLPMLLKTLDRIQNDEITRGEAAALLGVGERQINLLMKTWYVNRPLKEYLVVKAQSGLKWELRKKAAIEFISGSSDLETAALEAGVSTRQIRRWVTDLVEKHFGMVFKDLDKLPLHKRRRLADEVEEAEGLEIAKINVLNEVARGERAIEEVARERALARKRHQRGTDVRQQAPD